jgi:O-antigen/teichoic acid export membrane protein
MRVLANAFWLSVSRTAADLLGFVLFALISRRFGPLGTGQYSYAFAVGGIVALIGSSGLEEYGIRQYVRSDGAGRATVWQGMLSTQLLQLGVSAVALGIFLLVNGAGGSPLVLAELVFYAISLGCARTFYVPATANQAMVVPALTDFGCRLLAVGFALAMMGVAGVTLPVVLAGFPLGGGALVVLALRNARGHGMRLRLATSWNSVVETIQGSWAFAASSLLNQFYARADILIISAFLGTAAVGLYATDIKFVEVGLLPLVFLGVAAYPLLSETASIERATFERAAQDFVKVVLVLSSWLAVAMYWLIPQVIVPLFGADFAASVPLLQWIALFSLLKGIEVALYRVLYAAKRQTMYATSLFVGTIAIVLLNLALIPRYQLTGAILAGIMSTLIIDSLCASALREWLSARFFVGTLLRVAAALGVTAVCMAAIGRLAVGHWTVAILACVLFPVCALLFGLIPNPRNSPLLEHKRPDRLQVSLDGGP